mgnify:CR=1 FL=1
MHLRSRDYRRSRINRLHPRISISSISIGAYAVSDFLARAALCKVGPVFGPAPAIETLGAAYRALAEVVGAAGAREMLARRAGAAWADIIARPDTPLSPDIQAQLARDLERLRAGAPPGRVLGVRGFWGAEFALSPDTLEPRPDTETLVGAALAGPAPARILDLGTGTGCIALSLLQEWPSAWALATDIAPGALATARANAAALGLASRIAFACGHWGACVGSHSFALIVSNPPYIPSREIDTLAPEVRHQDPLRALDGGPDGLDAYRAIVVDIPRLLAPGGRALLEIGYGQRAAVEAMARDMGPVTVHQDLARRERVIEIHHGG